MSNPNFVLKTLVTEFNAINLSEILRVPNVEYCTDRNVILDDLAKRGRENNFMTSGVLITPWSITDANFDLLESSVAQRMDFLNQVISNLSSFVQSKQADYQNTLIATDKFVLKMNIHAYDGTEEGPDLSSITLTASYELPYVEVL